MSLVFFGHLGRFSLRRAAALWGLVLLVGLAGCLPAAAAQMATDPTLQLKDCRLSMPGLPMQLQARCGTLTVYENREAASGRQIALRVAVVPAASSDRAPDPVFLLAGGPGQAASEAFVPMVPFLSKLNFKHDLIMVDQRGTGQSHPLACKSLDDAAEEDPSQAGQMTAVESCVKALDADPRFYTTSLAMQDVDDVRAALGYEQINLIGVSYGTRAALVYARLFPQRVRTVVLDSVVPLDWSLGGTVARDAQRALDLTLARCAADEACRKAFPDTAGHFRALLADLKAKPAEVTLDHPLSGAPTQVRLTDRMVAQTVRLMSYSDDLMSLLPLLIHQAQVEKDYRPLAAQHIMLTESFSRSITSGLYYSVFCAEDAPYLPDAEPGDFYLDSSLDEVREVCKRWPHAQMAAEFRQPVQLDQPVLLLAGEADPVTPPETAQQAARTLTNSRVVVAPGLAHNVLYRGCFPKLIADFVEQASFDGLALDCMDTYAPQPFFTSRIGPQP